MKWFAVFSISILLGFSAQSVADLFEKPQSELISEEVEENTEDLQNQVNAILSEPTPKFLRVEEAYQLSPIVTQTELILQWQIAPGYYLYDEKLSFTSKGQHIRGERPEGEISFDENFNKDVAKHYHQLIVTLQKADFKGDSELRVESQGCADKGLCYPPEVDYVTIDWENQTATVSKNAPQEPIFLPWILLSALLGGLILNLLPCVFPVLSIKAITVVNTPEESHKAHGLSYLCGSIVTFTLIGATIIALRAFSLQLNWGISFEWGSQLQHPPTVTFLVYLFAVMGLCFSGVIHFSSRLMGVGNKLTQGTTLRASFFTGALAAFVASPCMGPFLSVPIAVALTQSSVVGLTVFIAVGIGTALPMVILSFWPHIGKYLPQPGRWMETFKQFLAFPLYLSAIWLVWILGRQTSSDAVIIVLLGLFVIVFLGWLSEKRPSFKDVSLIVGITLVILISLNIRNFKDQQGQWQPYNPVELEELRAQGKPVFINVTAAWCITCYGNEIAVFGEERMNKLKQRGLIFIKADLTSPDPEVSALLAKHQRAGVPLYLLYPPKAGEPPQILPQVLTPGVFEEAINASGLP